MEKTLNNIKNYLKDGDVVKILILINIIVFLILNIISVIQGLFGFNESNLQEYIALSSRWSHLTRFWTPFTYMFVQKEFLHILFNMVLLFFYGRLFLTFFRSQQLLSLYIIGGLGGAFLFLISYSVFPHFTSKYPSFLIGSSASLMAIIFGISIYRPFFQVSLFGVFNIKLIYLALILFFLDFFNLLSANGGGHIAHIGGAIIGYLFGFFILRGKDITHFMQKIFSHMKNIFHISNQNSKFKKNRIKSYNKDKFSSSENYYRENFMKKISDDEIDIILDKIKSSGYASLTREEKKKLFDASDKKE